MTRDIVRDNKHMGCMSGFLHIFYRHHILTGKRIQSPKTLPPPPASAVTTPSPARVKQSPLTLGVLEFKQGTRSSWKFSRETSRLSLDSRAVVDAKGSLHPREIPTDNHRRSTSVIVSLMGLEPLPDSDPQPVQKMELRRSASESRLSTDLPPQYRFFDGNNNSQLQQKNNEGIICSNDIDNGRVGTKSSLRHNNGGIIMGQKKKSFYDSTDFFPDPKHTVSLYGEIERRLKMRGIDKPSKDLETLKHILEALQLKGLLHSNPNSPIVVMKPSRSSSGNHSKLRSRRSELPEVDRNIRTQVKTPRIIKSSRRYAGGSPRMMRKEIMGLAEDESSTVSESSIELGYREGRNLVDRCEKLINSIVEITAANKLQPSPVSVLDSSFYIDESCSPSPITKRCIDYKDIGMESEDEMWSSALCSSEKASSEDCDLMYVSEILHAYNYMPEDNDIFLLLEKQQSLKGKDTSNASKLQRRLIFDIIHEILNKRQQLPPWKALSFGKQRHRIWSEFRRIRERKESEELFEVICGVLKKDMREEMSGWGEWSMEMGDVVLDMERLVFKDLIWETIQQLSSLGDKSNVVSALRRKLMF